MAAEKQTTVFKDIIFPASDVIEGHKMTEYDNFKLGSIDKAGTAKVAALTKAGLTLYTHKEFVYPLADITSNNFSMFIRDGFQYGHDIQFISVSIPTGEDFSFDKPAGDNYIGVQERVPQVHRHPKLRTSKLFEEVKYMNRVTVSPEYLKPYFKDASGVASITSATMAGIAQDLNRVKIAFLELLFNNKSPKYEGVPANWKTVVAKINKQISFNEIKVCDKVAEQFKATDYRLGEKRAEIYKTMLIHLSEISTTLGLSTGSPMNTMHRLSPSICPKSKQILIMSKKDHEAFFTSLGGPNHSYILQTLDGFHSKLLLDIPQGSFYLMDKDALRIYTRFAFSTSESFGCDLSTDVIYHQWFKVGVVPELSCVKYTMFLPDTKEEAEEERITTSGIYFAKRQ